MYRQASKEKTMATFVTRDSRITRLDRTAEIYVLTDTHGTLNQKTEGEYCLGFYGWHTDYEAAMNACKKAFEGGMGRVKITTIRPDDDIVYTGGAHTD
jgi:hypothetical protein